MSLKSIDGLPVIDAKDSIKLTVTSRDIEKADRKDPADCVVARACRRELHVKEARVHLSRVYLRSNDNNWVRYTVPKPMRTEIIAWDRGGSFESAEFELTRPAKTHSLGAGTTKKYKHKKYAKTGNRKRSAPAVVKNVRAGPA